MDVAYTLQSCVIAKMAKCSSIQQQVSPGRIHFLKFILEGYDGLATLSTVDARLGLVEIRFPPEMKNEIITLITAITDEIVY
jgi:hypothetical protein